MLHLSRTLSARCDDAPCSAFGACGGKDDSFARVYGEEPTMGEERQVLEKLKRTSTKFGGHISSCFKENAILRCAAICKDEEGPPDVGRLKGQLIAWLPNGSWWKETMGEHEGDRIGSLTGGRRSKRKFCKRCRGKGGLDVAGKRFTVIDVLVLVG